ncbi:hypothetical protein PG985_012646 [Apiospora marii]|uniref:uncharacterized protein n=1 Tax=Apiospora marii TaxID=335849 RepID=UPI00312F7E7E
MAGLDFIACTLLALLSLWWYLRQTEYELATHLLGTLLWAVCYEIINEVITTVRTEMYYEFIESWMNSQIDSEFLAWLGYPVLEDWDQHHPLIAYIVYVIRIFQIHVEGFVFSGLAYWMPTTALPPVAIRSVYLPIFLQRRPIYDSSASQWASDMWQRIPLEVLLSASLFYAGIALEVRRRARAPHSEYVNRRYRAYHYFFQDIGARVLSQSLYQVLFPMYLLIRPLCGLQLIPLLNGTTLLETYKQTSTGYAVLDPIVAVFGALLGPGNLWPTVYSIWLLVLSVIAMLLVAVCLFHLWIVCFLVIQLVMGGVDSLMGAQSHYVHWGDIQLINNLVKYAVGTVIFPANFLHLLLRDSVPFPRLHTRDHFLPHLAPAEREHVARIQQQFNNACGLYY